MHHISYMTVVHPYHPFVYPPSGLVMIGNTNMHTENVILNSSILFLKKLPTNSKVKWLAGRHSSYNTIFFLHSSIKRSDLSTVLCEFSLFADCLAIESTRFFKMRNSVALEMALCDEAQTLSNRWRNLLSI
jgi:hypothetical protein